MTDHGPVIAVVDCETTSLDRHRGLPWEITVIRRPLVLDNIDDRVVRTYMIDTDLADADPKSLGVGGFYERHPHGWVGQVVSDSAAVVAPPVVVGTPLWGEHSAALHVEWLVRDAHLVGANPAFDARMLENLFDRNGIVGAWHHRMYDVLAMAAAVRREPICGLEDSAAGMGIDTSGYALHTAAGDALVAERVFDEVMGSNTTRAPF